MEHLRPTEGSLIHHRALTEFATVRDFHPSFYRLLFSFMILTLNSSL
jgi:hypothetical protein